MDSGYPAYGFSDVGKGFSRNILRYDSPHNFIYFCYIFALQNTQLIYYNFQEKPGMGSNISILGITLLSVILLSDVGFAFEDAHAVATTLYDVDFEGPPHTVGDPLFLCGKL